PLLRIQLFANRRMNPVGGDQQAAVMAARRLAFGPVDEIGTDAVRSFRPAAKMMAGENVFGAEPFDCGIEQDLLQGAAMDRELRPLVAGLETSWFAPDRLAVLGEERQFLGADTGSVEPVE